MLFDIYDSDAEPYYFSRVQDDDVARAVRFGSVWIHGPSGVGKTSIIRRALSTQGIPHRYTCLAHCAGQTEAVTLRELLTEVREWAGLKDPDPERDNTQHLITLISQSLDQIPHTHPATLYVDELPLGADSRGEKLLRAMVALVNYHESRSTTHSVRIILSSIPNPLASAADYQRQVTEHLQVIPMSPWPDHELRGLLDRVLYYLPLTLATGQRSHIVSAAGGSPRTMKTCLRLLVTHAGQPGWNIERAIMSANAEGGKW